MHPQVIVFALLPVLWSGPQRIQTPRERVINPLVGEWRLDRARTHYGPGVDRRRNERMSCSHDARKVRCVIRSVRADGKALVGRFAASTDGKGSAVTGIPDVDEVQLRQPSNAVLDATFLSRGKPVFGYRALQSGDGRSLLIISVDPISRIVLRSVVVYDHL